MSGESSQLIFKILGYPKWRQRIRIKEGLFTPGYLGYDGWWTDCGLPESMNGKSFLDVGGNDGYFAFEAEDRGAAISCSSDLYSEDVVSDNKGGWCSQGSKMLKEYRNSKVEFINLGVFQIHQLDRKFDVILFSNVLSWLKSPIEALECLCNLCSDQIVIIDGFYQVKGPPAMYYLGHKEKIEQRVNIEFVRVMLKKLGFSNIQVKPYPQKHFEKIAFLRPWILPTANEVFFYTSPTHDSPSQKHKITEKIRCIGEYGDYYFAFRKGWVKKQEVQLEFPRWQNTKNKLKNLLVKIPILGKRFDSRPDKLVLPFIITANKRFSND